ncbi:PTS glucose transporter subunit IIA [Xylanimonas allomyrinae]|uniref:PTS glucose transporter subunit IIA n=1 Tax=Xylanimonas allomyrinae TaxID=2509459 RepID=A0A4P6F0I8_9MICO|nr:PTS glucose transporter subunit IIA [Xylanimonas allomyrinae]QAY63848.1 PTS glucose transporter subunit IIA [Xylanimonas allomyrinae]
MLEPLTVRSPVTGNVVDVADVPDPVFSGALVGCGIAVVPDPATGGRVVAPVDGTVAKLHPHAFVVTADDGPAVLVHLGIDTVELRGVGFVTHVTEGDHVTAGQVVTTWDPETVRGGGRSPVVPVIVLGTAPEALAGLPRVGAPVTTSDVLFTIQGTVERTPDRPLTGSSPAPRPAA